MSHATHAAHPTLANGQITDAIAQVGVTLLGGAAAQGLASQYLLGAHASGLALQNATARQRQGNTVGVAAATQAAQQILTGGPSRVARATKEMYGPRPLVAEIAALTAVVRRFARAAARPEAFVPAAGHAAPMVRAAAPAPREAAPDEAAASVGSLAAAAEELAKATKSLANSFQGSRSMGGNQPGGDWTEAVNRFRAALDGLSAGLDAVMGQLKESVDAEPRQRLQAAIDDIKSAAGQFKPSAPVPPVPAGATLPGVVIVGSGNVSAAVPARIVGASW